MEEGNPGNHPRMQATLEAECSLQSADCWLATSTMQINDAGFSEENVKTVLCTKEGGGLLSPFL